MPQDTSVFLHPNYSPAGDDFDYALIKLSSASTITPVPMDRKSPGVYAKVLAQVRFKINIFGSISQR